MKNICIYHNNCQDGFAAASVVYRKYGNSYEYIPMNYPYQYNLDLFSGRDVIFVDFSFSKEHLIEIEKIADSIHVFDHHKTAEENLNELSFCVFNLNKCGSVIAWEQLFPDEEIPLFLKYIQDRDLWKWELDKSKEISACIFTLDKDFDIWNEFLESNDWVEFLADQGETIIRYQEKCIDDEIKDKFELMSIAGYEIPCINCTHLHSEIAAEMSIDYPFAAVYFDRKGKRHFSLRSKYPKSGSTDVSVIAKMYGGGGHPQAAGFSINVGKTNKI